MEMKAAWRWASESESGPPWDAVLKSFAFCSSHRATIEHCVKQIRAPTTCVIARHWHPNFSCASTNHHRHAITRSRSFVRDAAL